MTNSAYSDSLRRVLADFSDHVEARLRELQAAAHAQDGIDGVVVEVFVDHDAEGPFDVWARFDGTGAFALDRRFDEVRHLFAVTWGEVGWEPEVPGRPAGWSRDELESAVLATVAEWISPLLPAGSPEGFWWIGTPDGRSA